MWEWFWHECFGRAKPGGDSPGAQRRFAKRHGWVSLTIVLIIAPLTILPALAEVVQPAAGLGRQVQAFGRGKVPNPGYNPPTIAPRTAEGQGEAPTTKIPPIGPSPAVTPAINPLLPGPDDRATRDSGQNREMEEEPAMLAWKQLRRNLTPTKPKKPAVWPLPVKGKPDPKVPHPERPATRYLLEAPEDDGRKMWMRAVMEAVARMATRGRPWDSRESSGLADELLWALTDSQHHDPLIRLMAREALHLPTEEEDLGAYAITTWYQQKDSRSERERNAARVWRQQYDPNWGLGTVTALRPTKERVRRQIAAGHEGPPQIEIRTQASPSATAITNLEDRPPGTREEVSTHFTDYKQERVRPPRPGSGQPPVRTHLAPSLDWGRVTATPKVGGLHEFIGYDCSRPSEAEVIQLPEPEGCSKPGANPVIREQPHQKYTLLQETAAIQVMVKRCQVKRTLLPFYCGNYDHVAFFTEDATHNHPVHVDAELCQQLWDTQIYQIEYFPRDGWGGHMREHHLELNKTNVADYTSSGTSWLANNWDGFEAECMGGPYRSTKTNQTHPGMLVWTSDTIEMYEEPGYIGEGGTVYLTYTQKELPQAACPVKSGFCYADDSTFVWPQVEDLDHCRLYSVKNVTGTEVTTIINGENKNVLVSDDQMIRLVIKGEPVNRCGRRVIPTEFPTIYVTADTEDSFFVDRLLPRSERILSTHTSLREAWLFRTLSDRTEEAIGSVVFELCQRDAQKRAQEFANLAARQKVITDGETAALGGGWFATATGEAWHKYQCRPVVVMARESEECYASLPVTLTPHDERKALAVERARLNNPNFTTEFYLEPYTHVLTTIGISVPCSAKFRSHYRNRYGDWVAATPAIMRAAAPRMPDPILPVGRNLYRIGEYQPDFGDAGLYSAQQLQEMSFFQRMPRSRLAAASYIGQRALVAPNTHYTANDYFRSLTTAIVPVHPLISTMHTVWRWLEAWGTWTSLIMGTYVAWRVLCWALNTFRRCVFPDYGRGWCGRMLEACCPAVSRLLDDLLSNPEDPYYGMRPSDKRHWEYVIRSQALRSELRQGSIHDYEPRAPSDHPWEEEPPIVRPEPQRALPAAPLYPLLGGSRAPPAYPMITVRPQVNRPLGPLREDTE